MTNNTNLEHRGEHRQYIKGTTNTSHITMTTTSLQNGTTMTIDTIENNNNESTTNTKTQHLVESTIAQFETSNLLAHPLHFHSFQPFQCSKLWVFRTTNRRTCCAVCQANLLDWKDCIVPDYLIRIRGSHQNSILKCLACSILVHRECAFRNHGADLVKQNIMCFVNYERIHKHHHTANNVYANDKQVTYDADTNRKDRRMMTSSNYVWSADGPPDHFWDDDESTTNKSNTATTLCRNNSFHKEDTIVDTDVLDESTNNNITNKGIIAQANVVFGNASNIIQHWFTGKSYDIHSSNDDCQLEEKGEAKGADPNHASSEEFDGELSGRENADTIITESEKCTNIEKDKEVCRHDIEENVKQQSILALSSIANVTKSTQNMLNAAKRVSFSYKNIGVATAAGAGVGGVVGFATAGPAGMLTGARVGSGVCQVMIAVDTIQFCVLAGGAIVGASQIAMQASKGNMKVLAISNDTQSKDKVAIIRPYPETNPDWEVITRHAKKKASWHVFLKSSRRKNDEDILKSDDSELQAKEKVFLLVSRSINNKNSSPGLIYRYLLDEFYHRSEHNNSLRCNSEENLHNLYNERQQRDDCHAIIHHLTLVVLEARPGLSSSSELVELTLIAIERLVFGELYSSVFKEISLEVENKEKCLHKRTPQPPSCQISSIAITNLRKISEFVTPMEKMTCCMEFLQTLCDSENSQRSSKIHDFDRESDTLVDSDSLLQLVCDHILALPREFDIYAEIGFLSGMFASTYNF